MKWKPEIEARYIRMCSEQKRLDPKTLKAYRIDLRQFGEYLSAQGARLDRETVKAYVSHLNREFMPRTVKRKIASLRAFCSWLEEEGIVGRSPFSNLRLRVQEPALLPRSLPARLIKGILQAAHACLARAPSDKLALRDTAVIELLFSTGIRVSELCQLKARDLDLADGTLRIFGKGKKERIVQITNPEVLALLRRYQRVCVAPRGGAFFQSRLGNPLSDQSVRSAVQKYTRLAGYQGRVTPHMFRHTLATLLLEEGVDIRYIQQLLGHSSIKTTQIYTHVAGAKQRDIFRQKHPRNRLAFGYEPEAAPLPQAAAPEGKAFPLPQGHDTAPGMRPAPSPGGFANGPELFSRRPPPGCG